MRPLQVPSFHTIIAADARRLPQDYPPSVSSGAAATTDTGHHKSPRSSRLAGTNYRYIIGPLTIKLIAEAHPVVSMRGSETHSGPETRISPRMALTSRPEARLKIDVNKMSRSLAEDHRISNLKLARAFQRLDDELKAIESSRSAIPMEIIFARAILRRARELRQDANREQR